MKQYVLDASAVLSFIIFDETTPQKIARVFEEYEGGQCLFTAPELLQLEVANALRSATKSKRLSGRLAREIIDQFLELDIKYEKIDVSTTLKLALEKDISVYDTTYLWLSKKHKAELITLDKKLEHYAKVTTCSTKID